MTRRHFFIQSLLTLSITASSLTFLRVRTAHLLQLTAGAAFFVVICTLGEFFNHLVNFIDHIKSIAVGLNQTKMACPAKKPDISRAGHARTLGNICSQLTVYRLCDILKHEP